MCHKGNLQAPDFECFFYRDYVDYIWVRTLRIPRKATCHDWYGWRAQNLAYLQLKLGVFFGPNKMEDIDILF